MFIDRTSKKKQRK